jgi:hypothetical protein
MADATPRFGLPYILPGQAQKELFHNEALLLVDAALQAAVEGAPSNVPPMSPEVGQCWLIGATPVGDWTGHPHALAIRSAGGWRYLAPVVGMRAWDKAQDVERRWTGTDWNAGRLSGSALTINGQQVVGPRAASIASPSGGTIIDAEARAAIAAVLVALKSHGLID